MINTKQKARRHLMIALIIMMVGLLSGYIMFTNPHVLLFFTTFFISGAGALITIEPLNFYFSNNKSLFFNSNSQVLSLLSCLLIAISLYIIITIIGIKYEDYHFANYSRKGKAIITNIEYHKGARYLDFKFKSGNQYFERSAKRSDFDIGDSVNIEYSYKNIYLVRIIEPEIKENYKEQPLTFRDKIAYLTMLCLLLTALISIASTFINPFKRLERNCFELFKNSDWNKIKVINQSSLPSVDKNFTLGYYILKKTIFFSLCGLIIILILSSL